MRPIAEIIWTLGASEDLLLLYAVLEERAPTAGDRFCATLDSALALLKVFPGQAPYVLGLTRFRRLLVGRNRQYGLYYSVVGSRLVVSALVDLRADPEVIRRRLEN